MVTVDSETVSYDLGNKLFLVIKKKNKLFARATLIKQTNGYIQELSSEEITFYDREAFVKFIQALTEVNKIAVF